MRPQKTRGGKPYENARYRNRHGTVDGPIFTKNSEPLRGGAILWPYFLYYRGAKGFWGGVYPGLRFAYPRLLIIAPLVLFLFEENVS